MSGLVVPLSSRKALDPSVAGGKGAGLARLLRNGFPVPPGFVITAPAFREPLREAMSACRRDGPGQALEGEPGKNVAVAVDRRALDAARRVCLDRPISDRLRGSVLDAYRRLGAGPVAVRSSMVGEDAAVASFAGQLESVLGVDGEDALLDAVRRVLASAFGDRLWSYLGRAAAIAKTPDPGVGAPAPPALAVVVQRMVRAEVAGVAFSVDPVTCGPGVVVEAVAGSGEALVQGRARPDRYRLDPRGGIEEVVPVRLPWLQLQETSILCHPGQNAKDILERQALTLLNLAGERYTYGWPDSPEASTRERRNRAVDPSLVRRIEPAGACVQVVHSRAAYQSFVAFEPPGNEFRVYVGRVRDDLVDFPAYNHWPLNQTASDGRFAQAADRVSSFSIAQGYPVIRESGDGQRSTALLYGMRNMAPAAGPAGGFDAVLAAARSWARPPAMRSVGGGFQAVGYDPSQRAYVWRRRTPGGTDLKAEIEASELSPIENLGLLIEGWDDTAAQVFIDGRAAPDVRLGLVRGLQGDRLSVWIGLRSTKPVALEVRGGEGKGIPRSAGATGGRNAHQ